MGDNIPENIPVRCGLQLLCSAVPGAPHRVPHVGASRHSSRRRGAGPSSISLGETPSIAISQALQSRYWDDPNRGFRSAAPRFTGSSIADSRRPTSVRLLWRAAIAQPNSHVTLATGALVAKLQWRVEQLRGQTRPSDPRLKNWIVRLQWRAGQLPGQTGPSLGGPTTGRASSRVGAALRVTNATFQPLSLDRRRPGESDVACAIQYTCASSPESAARAGPGNGCVGSPRWRRRAGMSPAVGRTSRPVPSEPWR